jgi:succinyl-CoA synthetase alpha subunit
LSTPQNNVVTVEDPIEMIHEDFNQIGVHSAVNVTFGNILRTILRQDPDIIMIGEIGGNAEAEAARWAKDNCKKPIAGFIAGATAPPGRRMGHAGAIVGGDEDTAEAKKKILAECGIAVAETPSDMATALLEKWGK